MQTELLIDCRQFDTPDSLHRYLAEQLAFPVYYGSNWDALYDVLSTYSQPLTLYITQTARFMKGRSSPGNSVPRASAFPAS